MKLLITSADRQIVLYSQNIMQEDGVYYAYMTASPHKVTRTHSTADLEVVSMPEDQTLPDDEFIIGKYIYTESGVFEIWEHWQEGEV